MNRDKCGRPAKTTGKPCRSGPILYGVACRKHSTPDELVDAELREMADATSWTNLMAKDPLSLRDFPACWDWPVVPGVHISDWHADRCAVCGAAGRDLVEDHCHDTGLIRGLLCRSCNSLEGHGGPDIFEGYRRRPPTVILRRALPYHYRFPTFYPVDEAGLAQADPEVVRIMGPRPEDPALAAAYLARAAEGEWKLHRLHGPASGDGMRDVGL